MTYSSLVADIQAYCERDDETFLAQIPRFIMMAENKLASMVRGLGYLRNVNGALTAHDPVLEKPARWRETSSFILVTSSGRVVLRPRTYEFCTAYAPDRTVYGQPVYYADYGYEHFLLAQTPDIAYTFELNYFERPEPLDDSNQVSWTTQYAPQLLLLACLVEAYTFLRRPEKVVENQQLFQEAATMVSGESTRRQVDHTVIRSPE